MKKKVFLSFFILGLLVLSLIKSTNKVPTTSEILLLNVEALATNENVGFCITTQNHTFISLKCENGTNVGVWQYSFTCTGGKGSCYGTLGTGGVDCNGNTFTPVYSSQSC